MRNPADDFHTLPMRRNKKRFLSSLEHEREELAKPSSNKFASMPKTRQEDVLFTVGERVTLKGCEYEIAGISRRTLTLKAVKPSGV